MAVRAAEEPKGEGDDMSGYGLGGKGSFFGFGRFQELQVGRLAMIGWTVIYSPFVPFLRVKVQISSCLFANESIIADESDPLFLYINKMYFQIVCYLSVVN